MALTSKPSIAGVLPAQSIADPLPRIDSREMAERRRLNLIAILTFGAGVVFRYWWLFHFHPAVNYIYSDMKMYVDSAAQLLDPKYTPSIADTVYPPGNSMFLAATMLLDPSLHLAMSLNFIISIAIPLIVGAVARELFGWRVALWSIVVMSVYYPVIDLAGFFMSENPFIFLLNLSLLLLLLSLRPAGAWRSAALAFVAGLLLSCAIQFKGQAVMPGFLIALFLLYAGWRLKWKQVGVVYAGVTLGVFLVLIPMTMRSTRLNEGRFCFVSTNGAMNFLLGHCPDTGTIVFNDTVRGFEHTFTPPPFAEKRNPWVETLPFGAYDSKKVMELAWQRVMQHKFEAFCLGVDQIFELFVGFAPWPSGGTEYRRLAILSQQLFQVLLLLPAGIHCALNWRSFLRREPAFMADIVVLLPIIGLIVTSFLTFGEARYRVPFDSFIILLALRFYTRRTVKIDNIFTRAAELARPGFSAPIS